MGGTDLMLPTQDAFYRTKVDQNVQKRVFILTDGYTSDKENVKNLVKKFVQEENSNTKVFTMGISDECDKDLV